MAAITAVSILRLLQLNSSIIAIVVVVGWGAVRGRWVVAVVVVRLLCRLRLLVRVMRLRVIGCRCMTRRSSSKSPSGTIVRSVTSTTTSSRGKTTSDNVSC